SDSEQITKVNKTLGNNSVSSQTSVASAAIAVGVEVGYDFFALSPYMRQHHEKLQVFGRYDYYDSMYKTQGSVVDNPCWGRQKITFGLNYSPLKDIVIKAEWSNRLFKSQFNNEPTISIGITYCGFFKL
ncbi:MAG: hypothetical protein LUD72_06110, partial [Bacteroidales bacterium]|nr:hypothetical protein [Bacteroidales bacterium]